MFTTPDLADPEQTNNVFAYEKISLAIRGFYSFLAFFAGSGYCLAWLFANIKDGTLLPFGWLWAPASLLGLWAAISIWNRKTRRVYATDLVPVTASARYRRIAWGTFILLSVLFLIFLPAMLGDSQMFSFLFALPVVALYAFFFYRTLKWEFVTEMTADAKAHQHALQHPPAQPLAEPSEWEKVMERLWEYWWVRYIVGIALAYLSYSLYYDYQVKAVVPVVIFLASLFCLKEVVGYLIGISIFVGLAYAAFGFIAALPVAVAIIIGALIIASAIKK